MMNGTINQQTKTSTRHFPPLYDTSAKVIPLEEESFCNLILDQLNGLVNYRQAIVAAVEGEDLNVRAYRRPVSIEEEMMRRLLGSIDSADVPPDTSWPKLTLLPPLVNDSPLAAASQALIDEYQLVMQNMVDFWLVVPKETGNGLYTK